MKHSRGHLLKRRLSSASIKARTSGISGSAVMLSPPESAAPTLNPQGSLRIRRNWELESMVPNFVFRPAAATGSGHCPAKTLAASIYGGQRSSPEPAAASGCRHGRPAAATGSGHCPAKTLAASIYGGQRSSPEPAAASGCRHGRPALAVACRLSLPGGS